MTKPGQAADPTKWTDGYRSVMNQLRAGTAGQADQAHAANWLRDLYAHWSLPRRVLEQDTIYRLLLEGMCGRFEDQDRAADWISRLRHGDFSSLEAAQVPDSSANDRQVAGTHYKKGIQHWDYAVANGFSYLGGQATKYVSRWKDKNGLVDLAKADHFIQKMQEVHNNPPSAPIPFDDYAKSQNLDHDERMVIGLLHLYELTKDPVVLGLAREALARLIDRAK